MNKIRNKAVLAAIIGAVFIAGGITVSSARGSVIKSQDGNIRIEYEKVREFNYLHIGDITDPPARMYKEHLEDSLAYIIKNNDYDKVVEIFMDINWSCDAPNMTYAKYVEYIRRSPEFKSLMNLIAYDRNDEIREVLIKILANSLKYNGI